MLLNSSDPARDAAVAACAAAQPLRDPAAFEADLEACKALIRTGSHSFYAASRLLPARVRRPAFALYAFCRLADDAVDLEADAGPPGPGGVRSRRTLDRLQDRLDRVYRGQPIDLPADRAFAAAVAYFEMPKALPEALLDGFAWDLGGRRYETFSDVTAYAARVAGSVGAMMSVVMGARSAPVLARACDLAVAMQLTNIARDVGEDARAGRLYLPAEWLREAGIDPDAWLAKPVHSAALAGVVARLLRAAERLYLRSETGIAALPADCRPAIYAARYIYAAIGTEVARAGFDSINRRASTSTATKLRLIGRSLSASLVSRPLDRAAALPEVRFLVEASALPEIDVDPASAPILRPAMGRGAGAWPPGMAQVDRVLDMFVRLAQDDADRRDQQRALEARRVRARSSMTAAR